MTVTIFNPRKLQPGDEILAVRRAGTVARPLQGTVVVNTGSHLRVQPLNPLSPVERVEYAEVRYRYPAEGRR